MPDHPTTTRDIWPRLILVVIGTLYGALLAARSPQVARCRQVPFAGHVSNEAREVGRINSRALGAIKGGLAHPEIPSVVALHLPEAPPGHELPRTRWLSPGLCDPYLEEARRLDAYDDFKPLSDSWPKVLSVAARQKLLRKARAAQNTARARPGTLAEKRRNARRAFLRTYIDGAYEFSDESAPAPGIVKSSLRVETGEASVDATFTTTEKILPDLVRVAPAASKGSLLPPPYPFLIAAPGRFRESYYWDTYFGLKGILATGRVDLAEMQVENFLEEVRHFGFVPNGSRDYYLSRSQPPFLSSLVREVYEAAPQTPRRQQWLRRRAYPLIKIAYENFWMNPRVRADSATGLNHDWDALDTPRPERHSLDDERRLGRTYRDVRAAAESGLDFTMAMQGDATHVAGVLLNSLLYKTECDLQWAAAKLGLSADASRFAAAAERRRRAIDKYLWNAVRGEYENYDLRTRQSIPVLSAVAFAPLFVGEASTAQAEAMKKKLKELERTAGLMASTRTDSTYQWDGNNGWAPLQVMAIAGLQRYGFSQEAQRIASKWVHVIAAVHRKTGLLFERYDVEKADYPGTDGTKYPTQVGFLWTNSSFVWALTKVLGFQLIATDPSVQGIKTSR